MPRPSHFDMSALQPLVAAQDGLVTYAQLAEIGFPTQSLRYLDLLGGPWQRILPGTYLVNQGTPNARQLMRSALLYAGDKALLTGAAALNLYGLRRLPETRLVHVIVPQACDRHSAEHVFVERSRRVPAAVERDGLLCAPFVRALVDAARRSTDFDAIRAMMAEAVQTRRCTVEALALELRQGPIRHSARARRVINEMAVGIRSAAEGWCRDAFALHQVPSPLWNAVLKDSLTDRVLASPDALWRRSCVIVEIDSREYHLNPADWERTQKRHAMLTALGFVVIHVSPARIKQEPGRVCAEILAALEVNSGRPWPATVIAVASDGTPLP